MVGIMALSAHCLWASVGDLKPLLGLHPADVGDDVTLEQIAEAVTADLERETGRVFVARALTDRIVGDGRPALVLRGYPVDSITTITEDDVAVASTEYRLDVATGLLWRESGVWRRDAVIVVQYVAGYARTAVPSDVLALGVDLVRAYVLARKLNLDVLNYQSQAGYSAISASTDWALLRRRIEALRYEARIRVA